MSTSRTARPRPLSLAQYRASRESSALIVTLVILTLSTLLVISFLGLASTDLQSTHNYTQSQQADQIALGGLQNVIGNLRQEITDPQNNSQIINPGSNATYVPKLPTNAFPQRTVPITQNGEFGWTNVVRVSSRSIPFYDKLPSTNHMASEVSSTNAALNGQRLTQEDWNKPQFAPAGEDVPIPDWVMVTREGPVAYSASIVPNSSGKDLFPTLGKTKDAVIGRYAYVIYDTSGMLDINVAGYPSAIKAQIAGAKGPLSWADLTQLPGVQQSDIDELVGKFRNAASAPTGAETNYITQVRQSVTNGFSHVFTTNNVSDSAFVSRQDLIKYAKLHANWTNALPYLTTFSRAANGPILNPSALAASASTIYNPSFLSIRVQNKFPRNTGETAVVGEPLVKYKFPLSKLALLETAKDSDAVQIEKYFGLTLDKSSSSGLSHRWTYDHGDSSGNIRSLVDVAAQGREPDFFELLQAAIIHDSLGVKGRGDSGYGVDYDNKQGRQIFQIGANIIDQWDADSYPTAIGDPSTLTDVYGIEDLPYLYSVLFSITTTDNTVPSNKAGKTQDVSAPFYFHVLFEAWNPHQKPASTPKAGLYPTTFRLTPDGNNDTFVQAVVLPTTNGVYQYGGKNFNRYYWNGSAYTTSATTIAFNSSALSTPNGNGVVQFEVPLANISTYYRDPSLVQGIGNGKDSLDITSPTNAPPPQPTGKLGYLTLPNPITRLPNSASEKGTLGIAWPTNTVRWPQTNNPPINPYKSSIYGGAFYLGLTFNYTLQYLGPDNKYRNYSTFIGPSGTPCGYKEGSPSSGQGVGPDAIINFYSHCTYALVKADPRTGRFGAGVVTSNSSQHNNMGNSLLNYNISTLGINAMNGAPTTGSPFFNNNGSNSTNRLDYEAVNNPSNPLPNANVWMTYASYGGNCYKDNDGVIRPGDMGYVPYSSGVSTYGVSPMLSGVNAPKAGLPGRPVMLNRPFNSVGELGYVFRDMPWKSLDFFTDKSADEGLLDVFTLSESSFTAGKINLNTSSDIVISALLAGGAQSSLNPISGQGVPSYTTNMSTALASQIASKWVSAATTSPITNAPAFFQSFMTNTGFTSVFPNGVKTERESVVRALSETANERTWNLLIDIVGQSGRYAKASSKLENFVVEGERRYWLHLAIDRYTSKVVDQQLEVVDP